MLKFYVVILITLTFFAGCNSGNDLNDTHSGLTHGNIQLTIMNGQTTQNQILEAFGPPNIMTHDSAGQEVWTYQRHATVSKSESSGIYGTVILAGVGSSTSGFERSSRTMTLIIKFDEQKLVSDFRSMATSF